MGISGSVLLLVGGAFTALGQQAGESGLTARQLFYKEEAPAVKDTPKKTGGASSTKTKKVDAPKGKTGDTAGKTKAPDAGTAAPLSTNLGIRYSLLALDSASRASEVDPDTVFRGGDKIQLQLMANQGGYLYVVHQGSSGHWEVLIPTAGKPTEQLRPMQPKLLPQQDEVFEFDQTPGAERLFIVLSKTTEASLQGLIESVQKQASRGAREPVQLAANRPTISSTDFDSLRTRLAARDLSVQKLKKSQGASENAVYIVNASTDGSRVIAEIALRHQ